MAHLLSAGSRIPEFILRDQDGNEVRSRELIGEKILVIYFYPKDFTPGCTREACSFRDNLQEFVEAGARVVGISSDSVATHQKFAQSCSLNYQLLSDPDRSVHQQFGIPTSFFGLLSGRVTFVIDLEGVIGHVFESQFQPLKHVSSSLDMVRELQKKVEKG